MSLPGGPGTMLAQNWKWYAAAGAGWTPRDGAGLVSYAGNMYMLGGWNPGQFHGADTTNEVWRFDGTTWTQLLTDDQAPVGRWYPRHTAGWLTHSYGGTNYIYAIGGDIQRLCCDVWRSTDGVSWTQMTAAAEWGNRCLHMAASYNGALYVMGGQTDLTKATAMHDVWRSTDGGATWTQLANAGWSVRGMVYNPCVYNGKLWVCGGGTYDAARDYYNDVWTFDGSTWTQVAASSPWAAREYHTTLVHNGELWVMNGYNGANIADAWVTQNGVDWMQRPPNWTGSHADGMCSHSDGSLWAGPGNHLTANAWRIANF